MKALIFFFSSIQTLVVYILIYSLYLFGVAESIAGNIIKGDNIQSIWAISSLFIASSLWNYYKSFSKYLIKKFSDIFEKAKCLSRQALLLEVKLGTQ